MKLHIATLAALGLVVACAPASARVQEAAPAVGTPAHAPEPLAFPGGDIDASQIDRGEIYLAEPSPAIAPAGCEIAERYVQRINAADFDGVAALYTEDAVVIHSGGAPTRGHEAIRAFYNGQISRLGVRLIPVAYAVGPDQCLVQLAVSRPGAPGEGQLHFSAAYDQFILAPDGRARMMVVYGRRSAVTQNVIGELRHNR